MFKTDSIETAARLVGVLDDPIIEISGKIRDFRNLLETEFWPAAVPEGLIVKNEEQAKLRARTILYAYDIVDVSNQLNKSSDKTGQIRLLDYGCGAGHTVMVAKAMGIDAYGYDVEKKWHEDDPALTTDPDTIKRAGPFSHILLYDVIDHVSQDQAQVMLENVKSIASANAGGKTTIIIRTHPWLSRHGAHTYYKINKAYAHLFLTEQELPNYTAEKVNKILRPMKYYDELFKSAGLIAETVNIVNRPIESFFKQAQVLDKFKELTEMTTASDFETWFEHVLSIEFVDYKIVI